MRDHFPHLKARAARQLRLEIARDLLIGSACCFLLIVCLNIIL